MNCPENINPPRELLRGGHFAWFAVAVFSGFLVPAVWRSRPGHRKRSRIWGGLPVWGGKPANQIFGLNKSNRSKIMLQTKKIDAGLIPEKPKFVKRLDCQRPVKKPFGKVKEQKLFLFFLNPFPGKEQNRIPWPDNSATV
ncbi:MAG: hypothetical protein AB1403_20555, partial [Candidatus Riflebacteria bacterium]